MAFEDVELFFKSVSVSLFLSVTWFLPNFRQFVSVSAVQVVHVCILYGRFLLHGFQPCKIKANPSRNQQHLLV